MVDTMRIFYEDRDVSGDVRCAEAELVDRYGSVPDEMTLRFWDEEGIWAAWNPQKGQRLRVVVDGFDTGVQLLDHPVIEGRHCTLRAISAASSARKEGWGAMQQVSLLEIARRCAAETGLELKLYGLADDPRYQRVARGHLTPLAWLVARCELENVAVKVDDNRLLLIGREWAQSQTPALELTLNEVSARAERRAYDATGSVTVLCGGMAVKARRVAPEGTQIVTETLERGGAGDVENDGGRAVVRNDVAFYSIGEGERYARNLLAARMREERAMRHSVPFDAGLAALSVVQVQGDAAVAGLWTVKSVTHCPIEDKSHMELEAVI